MDIDPIVNETSTELERRIRRAISANPYLAGRRLRFETGDDGRVVLRGLVGSWFQKQMAQEALRDLAGVDEIDNRLVVQWSEESP